MPLRSFDDDAGRAEATALPVPRGIAFRYEPDSGAESTADEARSVAAGPLPGWEIQPVARLPGWFEAMAPAWPSPAPSSVPAATAVTQPMPLSEFWDTLRALRAVPGVTDVAPCS
jgi:hypothetical protein